MEHEWTVIPNVIEALGSISKGLVKGLKKLKIRGRVEHIQSTACVKISQNTEMGPGDLMSLRLQGNTIS